MLETFLHVINCSLTLQTLIDKKTGKGIVMFEEPISLRNPCNFLKGKKYIVVYENLGSYCNSFMHVQRTLGIEDVKWHTKKIDKKDCTIFLRKICDVEDSEDDVIRCHNIVITRFHDIVFIAVFYISLS